MSYQFEVEPPVADPLQTLTMAELPRVEDFRYSTRAPYTACDLGAVMLGGRPTVDFEKVPATFIVSYCPDSGRLDANAVLSEPTRFVSFTLPGSREVMPFSGNIHAVSFGVSCDSYGLSFLGPDYKTCVDPEFSVDRTLPEYAVGGLKLKLCSKIVSLFKEHSMTDSVESDRLTNNV